MSNNLIYYLTISFIIWLILILEHECSPVILLLTIICNIKILFYYTDKHRREVPVPKVPFRLGNCPPLMQSNTKKLKESQAKSAQDLSVVPLLLIQNCGYT